MDNEVEIEKDAKEARELLEPSLLKMGEKNLNTIVCSLVLIEKAVIMMMTLGIDKGKARRYFDVVFDDVAKLNHNKGA